LSLEKTEMLEWNYAAAVDNRATPGYKLILTHCDECNNGEHT
jgi:hypothetical protein